MYHLNRISSVFGITVDNFESYLRANFNVTRFDICKIVNRAMY